MTPLGRVTSVKVKLALLIVTGIVIALGCLLVAAKLGFRLRWGAVAAVIISVGLVWILGRGTTAPLRAMTGAAEAMARGEHGVRVDVRSRDEVGRLAAAFNTMAAELEAVDRSRRDFVADAAHELRTPLTALRAQLENAADGVAPADPAALLAQVDRLTRLADQLLDLSRLEDERGRTPVTGAVPTSAGTAEAAAGPAGARSETGLERRPVPVAELLDGCLVPVRVEPADLCVTGDPVRLRQVVDNLLDNARRHAPGAAVVVRARAGPGAVVRLEVEDHGPGLAPGEADRIFDRFARADRARPTGGAGLGLAITRSIVELHGGAIHAEAADPHGCRMVVSLPAAP